MSLFLQLGKWVETLPICTTSRSTLFRDCVLCVQGSFVLGSIACETVDLFADADGLVSAVRWA